RSATQPWPSTQRPLLWQANCGVQSGGVPGWQKPAALQTSWPLHWLPSWQSAAEEQVLVVVHPRSGSQSSPPAWLHWVWSGMAWHWPVDGWHCIWTQANGEGVQTTAVPEGLQPLPPEAGSHTALGVWQRSATSASQK